nr:EOG090X03DI [Triops cancriformis]
MSSSITLRLIVFITFFVSSTVSEILLQSVQSSVGAGNFTYFTVTYDGPISLILESTEGDADLYVSQFTVQPTYEPEKYCLHSASCGIDRVDIPSDYKRPLGVGVYGHPLHPVSTFRLSVVYREALPSDQWTWYDKDFESDTDLLQEPPEPLKSPKMLEFENQIFLDVLHEDGLLIAAKGLALEQVFINLLKVYSEPGSLVLVIGTSNKEEEYFIQQLDFMGVKPLPRIINSDYSISDRQIMYLEGGVVFASSRILVVDMLMDRMPMEHLTGILVYKAQRVVESSQEAFILRLFRQKNKTGFIKAFSSSPVAFTTGFCQINRVMRNLFVKNLYLWPRFHAIVKSTLEVAQPQVIEIRVQMTPAMNSIQTAVLDLMNFTVKELRRCNPSLDLEEMTVENWMSKSFHKSLTLQLEPVWHQLSSRTKQLVADLKTLRTILLSLTQYDCVTFYSVLNSFRTAEQALQSSGWLLLDAADTLYVQARLRVYGKLLDVEEKKNEPKLEENPKWEALLEILKEIKSDCGAVSDSEPKSTILVVAEDERTCLQLEEVVRFGSERLLTRLYQKITLPKNAEKGKKGESSADKEPEEKIGSFEEDGVKILFRPLRGGSEPFRLERSLRETTPRFIVMYDCDMSFIRQVEVFQARNREISVHLYFLIYSSSAEEQSYLTTLRREKQAFETLIREKATMVIPEDREGREENHPDLVRCARKANETVVSNNALTRKGGLVDETAKTKPPLIVVDMREFRSELPALIHKRGIDIIPVTIEIGDYILTPQMSVERKSLSDLIGSLISGRLYNQCQAMSRYYSKPMLLIEFEHNKPFALQGKYFLSNDASSSYDVTSRLILLTIHFPKLRILWSPSPYATAEIFDELKRDREEPDPAKAASLTADSSAEFALDRYNPSVQVPSLRNLKVFYIAPSLCRIL